MKAYHKLLETYNKELIYNPNDIEYSLNQIKYITETLSEDIIKWISEKNNFTPLWKYLGFSSAKELCIYSLYPQSIVLLLKKDNFKYKLEKCFDSENIEFLNMRMFLRESFDFVKVSSDVFYKDINLLFQNHLKVTYGKIFANMTYPMSAKIKIGWFGLIEKFCWLLQNYAKSNSNIHFNITEFFVYDNIIKCSFKFNEIANQNSFLKETLVMLNNSKNICMYCGENSLSETLAIVCKQKCKICGELQV